MGVAVEKIELVAQELRERLGEDAVVTDGERLAAYEADTYWKAIAASAAGSPLGRPDLVVIACSHDDVATVLKLANRFGVPVVPWGGGAYYNCSYYTMDQCRASANGQMCSLNPYYAGTTAPGRRNNRRY